MRKILYFTISFLLPISLHTAEYGIGASFPNLGLTATSVHGRGMYNLSWSTSNISIEMSGERADIVHNLSLFYQRATSISYGKWQSIIGAGGLCTYYRKDDCHYYNKESGIIYSIGFSAGSYYQYSPLLKIFVEFQAGYPLTNNVIVNDPNYDINLLPFIPKIGFTYTIK